VFYIMKNIFMKFLFFLGLFILAISCKKKEVLKPSELKKVFLLKVDYASNKFLGGKEFSYLLNSSTADSLPITRRIITNSISNRLILRYGTNLDTIFDGTEIINGQGKVNFPSAFDNAIFYFKNQTNLTKPDNSKFQVLYYNISSVPIEYDSIWKGVRNLEIVQSYVTKNPSSKIGLFLFQPSLVEQNPGDWKWYLIFRE
jgi:hypothetical protein